jgi:hypothetical protein
VNLNTPSTIRIKVHLDVPLSSVRLNAGGSLRIYSGHVSSLQPTLFTNLTMLNYPCFFFVRSVSRNVASFICGNCVLRLISGMLADFWVVLTVVVVVIKVSVAAT